MENYLTNIALEHLHRPGYRALAYDANLLVYQYDSSRGRRVAKHVIERKPEEYENAKLWYTFLGFDVNAATVLFDPSGRDPRYLTSVDMPWLGYEIRYVPHALEICPPPPPSCPPFTGLTKEKAENMLGNTRALLDEFYILTGLLHVDFYHGHPDYEVFNVTYHPSYNFFIFIDAASFEAPRTIDDEFRFESNFNEFKEYVYDNLVIG